ncbi:hypothetical protein ACFLWJ_01335 [Chloroflexota bacterium]
MDTKAIYEETLSPSMMKVAMAVMGVITVLFLVLYIYQLTVGPIGSTAAPDWYYLLLFIIFAVITAFLTNFRKLTITITSTAITVRYGMLKSMVPWDNIARCTMDKDSSLGYGGFGLRLARGHGTWIRAYNLMSHPRIALDLKAGKSKRLVFSTKSPEQIIEIAKQQNISTI